MHPVYGATQAELAELYPRLLDERKSLIDASARYLAENLPATTDKPETACDADLAYAAFYAVPRVQLEDYAKIREESVMGRVFKVANTQMDWIDAVVVLGTGDALIGPRALMNACCDPFHNELKRGPRGSKPRMYFAGDNFDNDYAQALLSRIADGGYDDTLPEQRWALVPISKSGKTFEPAVALRPFLGALQKNLEATSPDLLKRLTVPITGTQGRLRELANTLGCEEVFAIPGDLPTCFSIFSPVGLLPAAMLSLDIMKLLEGAIAMNEHFEQTSPDKNVVLQYVALNHLLSHKHGRRRRVLSTWCDALETVGFWYDHLTRSAFGRSPDSPRSRTVVNPRAMHLCDGLGRGTNGMDVADQIINHLVVEQDRTDPLWVGHSEHNTDQLNELADGNLTSILASSIDCVDNALHAAQQPTTRIIMPTIDTFVLGQLFQMLMIATTIESRLLGLGATVRSKPEYCNFDTQQLSGRT